ncbi:putative PI phosphatase group protein-like protein [Amylocarpus encephaloides]|uniref:PI phosphatase group protein-like protein n=1 Tax=Amylocarpus encephaloides TaxID=45428 RepID=A0A9P7Y7Y8_9HELO|nr:putative PI phosphatase group protein-like protein [Amylocarpus encephaloides]
MEETQEESLDGSSIKPVSSLRSHFEQMANAKAANNGTTARAPSPRPNQSANVAIGEVARNHTGKQECSKLLGDTQSSLRGREREMADTGLKPFRIGSTNMSPSPTRSVRTSSVAPSPPAVTVEPPQSPPKVKVLNLSLSSASSYLSTDTPLSTTSGGASPRHFRIPSRPHTPLLEPRNSPSLPSSQPPSPPPPRRSGEMRRDSAFKPFPPPVNRSEKPKIGSKPAFLGLTRTEATALSPSLSAVTDDRSSPFGTPPSNPEYEDITPALRGPRPRQRNIPDTSMMIPAGQKVFDPPPVHHTVIGKRQTQEANGLGRGIISPQVTGDQRPALPNRPQVVETSNTRSIMPPPPRPSVDRSRPVINTDVTEDTKSFATPPKRVFSTPTSSQLQTPPRSHGRSMTVDRTSEKTPSEFRTPPVTRFEPRPSLDLPPPSSQTSQPLIQSVAEYPDSSNSNRRPPYFNTGSHEISTKYDTRLIDVCGQYVCTSGHLTRVWNLHNGDIVMSLAHTEGIKIVSMAFKPTAEVKDEGSRLWLGNNIGDIMEVDVATQSVATSKANAHTRREVIKIYRHKTEMWTLDDGGTFHLWGPDSTGIPVLSNPYQSFRVPKGHTFSMVVGDELWHAVGKDIRIFMPTVDGSVQFQVLARPLNQPSAGEVTSGAAIPSQPDRVYFGHTDGKVSIYSRRDFACLGVVNISVYKITTLASEGDKLWAGFSTGMVYIYDIMQTPWHVKKDWKAHNDPVIKLLADSSSFWSLDRAQVVSLGQDNAVRLWDGLLQDDWLETQMQSQEPSFCEFNQMKALVMTWNAGAATPFHLQHSDKDSSFFRDLLQNSDSPDILVFGFQELVDLEDKTRTAKSFFKSKKKDPRSEQEHMSHQYRDWRDFLTRCIDDYMPRSELYHLIHTATLVGLFTCIFVRAPLRDRIRSVSGAEVKRGMGGLHGNKGALVVRFVLDDTSLCFINCHLAAGQTQTKDRNNDITSILESSILPIERDRSVRQDSYVGGGDGSMIMDHELCILNGDLNYRIDTMGRDTVVNAVKAKNLAKLLERDQLLASKRKNPWFKLRAFDELPITFAPTYKYDVGTDNYDTSEKKRSPAWCDRILCRGRDRIQQVDYQRHEVRLSDHRPVTGQFDMVIKTISPQKRAVRWDECQHQWLDMKAEFGDAARLNYLTIILGFDIATSKKMILQSQKSR